jgi:hypothetical protein
MRTTRSLSTLALALLLLAPVARAEEGAQTTMDIVREGLKSDKKVLVATNMELTDAEAKAFWPVYDRYQKELFDVQSQLVEVVEEYAATRDTLTDDQAKGLVERYLGAEEARTKVRRSYLAAFAKTLPGKKLARFYQIENKIDAVVRFELASEIPLVQAK